MEYTETEPATEGFLVSECAREVKDGVYYALLEIFPAGSGDQDLVRHFAALEGDYRYMDTVSELRRGRYVRWMGVDTRRLVAGGIVVDIEPGASGSMLVTCKNAQGRIFRFDFNRALTFQKLGPVEKVILEFNNTQPLAQCY